MLPVHPDVPVHGEEMNNVGYDTSGSYAYDDLFPALPHSQPPVQRNIQQVTNKLRVGSSLHTQVSMSCRATNTYSTFIFWVNTWLHCCLRNLSDNSFDNKKHFYVSLQMIN